jgi:hypothetical protein
MDRFTNCPSDRESRRSIEKTCFAETASIVYDKSRAWHTFILLGNTRVLTEKEVSRSWQSLFKGGNYTEETFVKAEGLLDELRLESPLRHRLNGELEELRKLQVAGQ